MFSGEAGDLGAHLPAAEPPTDLALSDAKSSEPKGSEQEVDQKPLSESPTLMQQGPVEPSEVQVAVEKGQVEGGQPAIPTMTPSKVVASQTCSPTLQQLAAGQAGFFLYLFCCPLLSVFT